MRNMLSLDEQRKIGRENGWRGAKARGYTPWTKEELERAYELSLNKDYQYQEGYLEGMINRGRVANQLNKEFHEGCQTRNTGAVAQALKRYKMQRRIY